MDKTSLLYWFPLIKDLPDLHIPKTEILELTPEEITAYHTGDGDCPLKLDRFVEWIQKYVEKNGLPVFLRTDRNGGFRDPWRRGGSQDNSVGF